MSISQKELARLLGVTQAAVSLALSDSPRVSAELRLKARELCGTYGYHPNHNARSLLSMRTGVVSLLRDDVHKSEVNHYWAACIQRAVSELGYRFRIDPIGRFAQVVGERSTDGFIAMGTPGEFFPDLLAHAQEGNRNVVFTDCVPMALPTGTVAMDNRGGAATAVRHLVELGHRVIGYLGLVQSHGVSRERHAGYVQEMNNLGLSAPDRLTVRFGEWPHGLDGVYRYEEQVMELLERGVTAVLACSDLVAVGAIKVMRRQGVSVPADCSVTGFDDTLASQAVEPSITVLVQRVEEGARVAAEMVVAAIDSGAAADSVVLPTDLLVRESTGPVPTK